MSAARQQIIDEVEGLDVSQVARAIPCSEGYVRGEIRNGRLKAKKLGRRVIVAREELQRYISDLPDWQPGEAPIAANAARRLESGCKAAAV